MVEGIEYVGGFVDALCHILLHPHGCNCYGSIGSNELFLPFGLSRLIGLPSFGGISQDSQPIRVQDSCFYERLNILNQDRGRLSFP